MQSMTCSVMGLRCGNKVYLSPRNISGTVGCDAQVLEASSAQLFVASGAESFAKLGISTAKLLQDGPLSMFNNVTTYKTSNDCLYAPRWKVNHSVHSLARPELQGHPEVARERNDQETINIAWILISFQ